MNRRTSARRMDRIIQEIAEKNHVAPEEVRRDMDAAIRAAFENPHKSPAGEAARRRISPDGSAPSVEDFVAAAAAMIQPQTSGGESQARPADALQAEEPT